MSQRRSFLLRIDPAVLDAAQRWADEDLRSLNGQIEFILRRALAEAGRLRKDNVDESGKRSDEGSDRGERARS